MPGPRLPGDRIALVFVGGCVGGAARFAVGRAWGAPGTAFPAAILAVNLAGALVLGLLMGLAARLPARYLLPLVGTGFCGGLTTFSSVVVAADRLVSLGRTGTAAGYLGATVAGGLAAAYAGVVLGRLLVRYAGRGC